MNTMFGGSRRAALLFVAYLAVKAVGLVILVILLIRSPCPRLPVLREDPVRSPAPKTNAGRVSTVR